MVLAHHNAVYRQIDASINIILFCTLIVRRVLCRCIIKSRPPFKVLRLRARQ